MAKWSADTFITSVVALSVGIVVFAMVALPIINSATAGITDDNLKAIVNVIPIFIAIGILMACIYMFVSKKA
ncbi:MAG: hypothetical protein IKN41_08170 [Candidatus Methanomethylophilaceae archaeon]|nr:hypothetical protein [Candidatus Methanomethylophilaceae archaeon]